MVSLVLVLGARRRRLHRWRRRSRSRPPVVDRGGPQGQPDLRRLGLRARDRRLPGRRRHLQRQQRRAPVKIKAYATHDDLIAALDSGEVPDVFLVSRGDLADLQERDAQPAHRRPARRPRRRLRRRLLAAGARGLRQRPRAPVHALRHLADGHLLQHRARRLPGDGRARPRRTHRRRRGPHQEADLDPRAVPDRGRRTPAARAAASPASTSRPRCGAWRRSSTPAAARSSTTTTSRPRWPSPPTTPSRPSRRCCRRCATRS